MEGGYKVILPRGTCDSLHLVLFSHVGENRNTFLAMLAKKKSVTEFGCQSVSQHLRSATGTLQCPWVLCDQMPRKYFPAATDSQSRLLPDGSMSCTRCEGVRHLVQQCISDVPRQCLGVHHVMDGQEDRLDRVIAQASSHLGPIELEAPVVQTMFFE